MKRRSTSDGKEVTVTLVCPICKALQGEIYRIPVSGVGDVIMCNHVVECVVQIHQVVADRPEEARAGCAA